MNLRSSLFLALLSGVGGGLVIASCGPTKSCTPSSCLGCCDASGACRIGSDTSACGTKGAACQNCGLQTCVSGACFSGSTGAGSTGAGTSGGVSSGGGSAGGGSTGGGFVTGGGLTGGGSAGGGVTACNATNCPGCCDNGQCFTGRAPNACGNTGATCQACNQAQICAPAGTGGVCVSGTGGGSAGGGGAGGGSTACSPQSCPTGCCSNGSCRPPTTVQCGRNGSACIQCPGGSTCLNGACAACTGCVDLQSGTCVVGTSTSACGTNGALCQACGANQTCSLGSCVSTPPNCTPQNCASGCCNGTTCVPAASQSNAQCGSGGAACAACVSSSVCDTNTGTGCVASGFDGGLPFPDGGFFNPCTVGTDCGVGECCYNSFIVSLCATIGNPNLLGGTTCGRSQQMCGPSCSTGQVCTSQGLCF